MKAFPLFSHILFCATFCLLANFASPAYAGRCGTPLIWQQQRPVAENASARSSYKPITNCDASSYYDTTAVQEKTTTHFRIYYVLEGPHATKEAFIDTLAVDLEKAWEFYVSKLRYLKPIAADTTWHYQKASHVELFPVEVLDLSLVRNNESLFQGYCEGCMGFVFAPGENAQATQIFIDNDFYYQTSSSAILQSEFDASCTYPEADVPQSNSFNEKLYPMEFGDGIRVTVFHEFYHTLQFAYTEVFGSYWFEASATAFEEITVPDINDYWNYLPTLFSANKKSFSDIEAYSIAIWGLYNDKEFGRDFDKKIWERFSKNSDRSLEDIFAEELNSRKLDPDSAFQDFISRLFFSGDRASFIDTADFITGDAAEWNTSPQMLAATTKSVELEFPAFAYYRLKLDSLPDLSNFQGKASVAFYGKKQKALFVSLDTASFTSLAADISSAENAVLILSHLRNSSSTVPAQDSLPMRSFPNPWRGESPLCFAGLPDSKKFIEIRTRLGKLVKRYQYTASTFCLDADEVKNRLAPGLYYFRAGAHSKLQPFIVMY